MEMEKAISKSLPAFYLRAALLWLDRVAWSLC